MAATRKRPRNIDADSETGPAKQPSTAKKTKQTTSANRGSRFADQAEDDAKSARNDESGKQYWLMKAEQEDREVIAKNGTTINAKFTIDDLKAKSAPEPWDGVRNIVARNNMRAMKVGDQAFFYASGGKGKLKPGITGVMEIVKEHEADWTVSDEGAYGYVEEGKRGTSHTPQWSLVHVEFRKKLSRPVSLKELQQHAAAGEPLEKMQLLSNSRVSVSKVTEKQWNFIVNNLVESYTEQ